MDEIISVILLLFIWGGGGERGINYMHGGAKLLNTGQRALYKRRFPKRNLRSNRWRVVTLLPYRYDRENPQESDVQLCDTYPYQPRVRWNSFYIKLYNIPNVIYILGKIESEKRGKYCKQISLRPHGTMRNTVWPGTARSRPEGYGQLSPNDKVRPVYLQPACTSFAYDGAI
jgi:hypothetical protein